MPQRKVEQPGLLIPFSPLLLTCTALTLGFQEPEEPEFWASC